MIVAIIVVAVLASVVSDIIFFRWWIRKLRREAIEFLRETLENKGVIHVEDCSFLGQLSSGRAQFMGNGLLALTREGLGFRMLLPHKYIFIPLDRVRQVSQVKSFLGRTRGGALLRVDFAGDQGSDDACAWLVPSLDWWVNALNSLLCGGQPPEAPGI